MSLSSVLKKIGRFIKKVWDTIRKYIAIILVIVAVIFFFWAALIYVGVLGAATFVIAGVTISITALGAVLLGVLALTGAFLFDSDAAHKAVGEVADALGEAAKSVGIVAGAVTGGLIGGATSGLFGTTAGKVILIGGAAVLAWWLLGDSGGSEEEVVITTSGPSSGLTPIVR